MKKYDVVGVGNAIVDCLAHVSEEFLASANMSKGSMQLISAQEMQHLLSLLASPKKCSGGSVANTIAALASLGNSCAFLGRIADDELGHSFSNDIRASGVTFNAIPTNAGKPTACCVICVTPDGERTMNTFIGASSEVTTYDIDAETIADSKILYLEGYLWDAEPAKEAILQAIHIAHDHGLKIAFSASDAFCVNRHREEFMHLIEQHVDILFTNESEAEALLRFGDSKAAALKLAQYVEIAIVTRSADSALIASGKELITVKPAHVAKVVDATGAGDLFAAGFLHGYLERKKLQECGEFANKLAGHIIQQLGARSIDELPKLI